MISNSTLVIFSINIKKHMFQRGQGGSSIGKVHKQEQLSLDPQETRDGETA